jgi:hypothetical protein
MEHCVLDDRSTTRLLSHAMLAVHLPKRFETLQSQGAPVCANTGAAQKTSAEKMEIFFIQISKKLFLKELGVQRQWHKCRNARVF